jgi:hypothetical protein
MIVILQEEFIIISKIGSCHLTKNCLNRAFWVFNFEQYNVVYAGTSNNITDRYMFFFLNGVVRVSFFFYNVKHNFLTIYSSMNNIRDFFLKKKKKKKIDMALKITFG